MKDKADPKDREELFEDVRRSVNEAFNRHVFEGDIDSKIGKAADRAMVRVKAHVGEGVTDEEGDIFVLTGPKYKGSVYNDVPVLSSSDIDDGLILIGRMKGFGPVESVQDESRKGLVQKVTS